MGIPVEMNPDLCLRNISEYNAGRRMIEECIPDRLEAGNVYEFLKSERRLYWMEGQVPLRETIGGQKLSRPKACVTILNYDHFLLDGKPHTKGVYRVDVLCEKGYVYFDGYERLDPPLKVSEKDPHGFS